LPIKKSITSYLYFWVIIAAALGILIGLVAPEFAVGLRPLGEGFIALIKMLIGPVIFCTVVLGIATAGDMKKVGRVGGKALIYFEIVSTASLIIGLVVMNLFKPGSGFNADPASLNGEAVMSFTKAAEHRNFSESVLHIIPSTFTDAFTGNGDLLQILLIAILFGFVLSRLSKVTPLVQSFIAEVYQVFAGMMNLLMKLAPLGAAGALAFTVGKFGIESLKPMLLLMLSFYLTCVVFIFGVLGAIAHFAGFNIWKFILYLRDELLTVLATSSSESGLVPLMQKLEKLGCSKSVVGLVVPSGYSFNLDGTNIYLTMALLFVAQALNIDLSLSQQLSILLVAMLTSKGASGVTGAGFITLAATLTVVPTVPVAGLALILGIDRFMSEARALTNFIGNGVATIVIARWEKDLDLKKLKSELS